MDGLEKFLIVGLGNPGATYQNTRHNVGFHILQLFAERFGAQFKRSSNFPADAAQASVQGKKVILLMPTTYMNASGEAVRRCMDYYKVPLDHLIVVSDDVALPIGAMRIRSKGSCGGHKGLMSIEAHLNTEHYARFKIGVGSPGNQVLADYVLDKFTVDETEKIKEVAAKALEVLELWVTSGIAAAMQSANQVKKEEGDK